MSTFENRKNNGLLATLVFALFGFASMALPFLAAQESVKGGDDDSAAITALIKKLQSSSYQERNAASESLARLGDPVINPLFEAMNSSDFETSFRALKIIKKVGLNSNLDTLETIIRHSQDLPETLRKRFDDWSMAAIENWKKNQSSKAVDALAHAGATITEIDELGELGLMLLDDFEFEVQKAKSNKPKTTVSVLEQIADLKKELAGEPIVRKPAAKDAGDVEKGSNQDQLEINGRRFVIGRAEVFAPSVTRTIQNPKMVTFDKDWNGDTKPLVNLRFLENLNQVEFVEIRMTEEILTELLNVRRLRSLKLTRCQFDMEAMSKFKAKMDQSYPLQLSAIGFGYLGVYGPNAGEPNEGNGSYVSMVSPNSAASEAGLERGDFIVKVDGEKIRSFAELSLVISTKPVGKKIKIAVKRSQKEKVLTAVLKSREGLR